MGSNVDGTCTEEQSDFGESVVDDVDYATAEAQLAEAIAQIDAIKKIKKKLGKV